MEIPFRPLLSAETFKHRGHKGSRGSLYGGDVFLPNFGLFRGGAGEVIITTNMIDIMYYIEIAGRLGDSR
jgi:hypothetical protein